MLLCSTRLEPGDILLAGWRCFHNKFPKQETSSGQVGKSFVHFMYQDFKDYFFRSPPAPNILPPIMPYFLHCKQSDRRNSCFAVYGKNRHRWWQIAGRGGDHVNKGNIVPAAQNNKIKLLFASK